MVPRWFSLFAKGKKPSCSSTQKDTSAQSKTSVVGPLQSKLKFSCAYLGLVSRTSLRVISPSSSNFMRHLSCTDEARRLPLHFKAFFGDKDSERGFARIGVKSAVASENYKSTEALKTPGSWAYFSLGPDLEGVCNS